MHELAIIAQHPVAQSLAGSTGIRRLAMLTLVGVACLLVMTRCARRRREGGFGLGTVVALAALGLAVLAFQATPVRTAATEATAEAVRTVGDDEPHHVGISTQTDVDTVVTVEVPARTSIRATARQARHRLRDLLRGPHPRLKANLPAIGCVFTLLLIGYAGCRACLGRRFNWPVGVLVIAAFITLMAAAAALG